MTDEARLQRWLNGQRRSHQRTFQSRELVWSSLETIARDTNTAMDQLIGEAMEAYAEQRGYRIPEEPAEENWASSPYMQDADDVRDALDALEETRDAPGLGLDELNLSYAPPAPAPRRLPPDRPPSFDSSAGWDDDSGLARTETRDAIRRRNPALDIREPGEESRTKPRFSRGGSSAPSAPTNTQPPTLPVPAAISRPVPTPIAGSTARGPRPPMAPPGSGTNRAVSAPPPMTPPPVPKPFDAPLRDTGSNPALKRLWLVHQGRQVEVDKERFLLGRSKTQADLRLEDPNVSRQHAAIERVGSAWYVVDLGSTNGIFVNGQRVTRRALAEGDLIVITSQEIRCTFR